MTDNITVYVSIGNSDDKLSQKDWAFYYKTVNKFIELAGKYGQIHGRWVSEANSEYQNACWCIEFDPDQRMITRDGEEITLNNLIMTRLIELATTYGQDSIAWAKAETIFLGPES